MSDIKEIISRVNGMRELKAGTVGALQRDIKELKSLIREIDVRMQAKKQAIRDKEREDEAPYLVNNNTVETQKAAKDDIAVKDAVPCEPAPTVEPEREEVAAPIVQTEAEQNVAMDTKAEQNASSAAVAAPEQQPERRVKEFERSGDRANRDFRQQSYNRDNRQGGRPDGRQQSGFNRDGRPMRDGRGAVGNQGGRSAGNAGGNQGGRTGGFASGDRNNRPPRPMGGGRVERVFAPVVAPPVSRDNAQKKKKTFEKDDNKKQLNKRTLIKKGYVDTYNDDDDVVRVHKQKKAKKASDFTPNTVKIEHAVVETKVLPIKTLAEKIGIAGAEIVKKLFLLGQMCNVNGSIDFDTAELVAMDYGITLEYKPQETAEDILQQTMLEHEVEGELVKRPPVVTIMGHVDHGKTSLLDYIRKSKVASGEAGGITQHIGAYTIQLNGEPITFLDTPGHEAFTSMRKRGAMVTDIAIIVVAADDGIMPQTVEAISHAKEAGVEVMIAINKMDKTSANPDKVMEEMGRYDLVPEAWGGNTMVYPVSAKTGMGVDELLEGILLLAEYKELKAVKDCPASGSIIEARLDKGVGPVATCLIQQGTLKVGDYIVAGTVVGKVRALVDNNGKQIKSAGPSIAVSIHGLSDVPNAGDQLICVKDDKLAKKVAQERYAKEREEMESKSRARSLDDMFKGVSAEEKKSLGIIIKGDVQGSVEAVKQEFIKLGEAVADENVVLTIIHAGVGAINESDVMLADTGNAVIVGFNVRPEPKARQLAEKNGVDIKIYRVIYDAIDDIQKALKGMLDPIFREEVLGHAEVRETFNISKVGTIAGCYVTDGKVLRTAKFRLIRDNVVVYDGNISSMKRNKDEAKEVASGYECGIGLAGFNDIKIGDIIEAFILKEEQR